MKQLFYVKGMHCAACEILIEKTLSDDSSVKSVNASLSNGTLSVESKDNKLLSVNYLNKVFKEDGYSFSTENFQNQSSSIDSSVIYRSLILVFILITGYVVLSRSGISSLVSVGTDSSLPLFFVFGLLAGVSSCAALVGGIILSLSKQWLLQYSHPNSSFFNKSKPHLLFNLGRVLGYAGFGSVLGVVGNYFRLSSIFSAGLVIGVSILMIVLGLQMIGVKAFQKFQIKMPKFITNRVADETNFQGQYAPFIMGALTFFLPCGFTITSQALALASGSPLQGAMIMGLFALGTVPGLLAIGLGSIKMYSHPKLSSQFSLVAGILVLFFAIININSQLSLLGVANFNDIISPIKPVSQISDNLPPVVNGKQIVKINASSNGYLPNYIILRANTPTRWEVTATNVSGCTNAIISRSLFDGRIDLVNGTTSVKEFTSPSAGVYRFSCWMGMINGSVEVVDSN